MQITLGQQYNSQVFPWHFFFMREHSLVELTEHDDSAANIIVHSMYTYNSMFARLGTNYEIRNQWFFAILEAMTTD